MPKKVDHQQRREQIAAALMRVAANEGLEGVSLRRVAAEAGVTSGMVQHYFPSKEAMMDFAMQSASARFEARMSEAVASLGEDPPARALLRRMLGTLLPMDESQRADARVALAFLAHAATRPEAAQNVGDDTALLRDFVADRLRDSQAAGGVEAGVDPVAAAAALLATAEGLALHLISSGLPVATATAALETQLDLIFGAEPRDPAG